MPVKPQYHRTLEEIAIGDFAQDLELASMIPSRKNLGEDIPGRLKLLKDYGIGNVGDLLGELKTPKNLQALAQKTGLPEDYLLTFRRELGSILPKPVRLDTIPSLEKGDIEKLRGMGIKDTLQMFDAATTDARRSSLAEKTGIPPGRILELAKLADVCRIKWVGANFARVLVDSGYDTAEKIAGADYRELYTAIVAANERGHYYKGKIGQNDIRLCVLAATRVPPGISI
jgi:hypothetical protein